MTQVVQNIGTSSKSKENLKGFDVIPIILYPSQKNEKSANFESRFRRIFKISKILFQKLINYRRCVAYISK